MIPGPMATACRFVAVSAALTIWLAASGGSEAGASTPGGAAPGARPPSTHLPAKAPARTTFPISKPTTLRGVVVTEYWPAPEKWFVGRKVRAPGLKTSHRVDFLYSAKGVAMEGDGVDLSNRPIHWAQGPGNWVGRNGRPGSYFWVGEMFWLNRGGEVTFPLERGGWSNGSCRAFGNAGRKCRYIGPKGTRFATGPSRGASGLKLRPLRSVAVDPRVIRYRSAVYIPAYAKAGHDGWFCAADTGGAIKGRHLDVFRRAPATPSGGAYRRGQTVRVWPPDLARRLYPALCGT